MCRRGYSPTTIAQPARAPASRRLKAASFLLRYFEKPWAGRAEARCAYTFSHQSQPVPRGAGVSAHLNSDWTRMDTNPPFGPTRIADLFWPARSPFLSMFPPKGELSEEEAVRVTTALADLGPAFVGVTCSAGGSGNGEATTRIAAMVQDDRRTTAVAHLTCQGLTRGLFERKVVEIPKARGIETCWPCAATPGRIWAPATSPRRWSSSGPWLRRASASGGRLSRGPHILCEPRRGRGVPAHQARRRRQLPRHAALL